MNRTTVGRGTVRRKVGVAMWAVLAGMLLITSVPTLAEAQGRVMEVFVTNDDVSPVPITGEVSVLNQATAATASPYQFAEVVGYEQPSGRDCTPIEAPAGTVLEIRTIVAHETSHFAVGAQLQLELETEGARHVSVIPTNEFSEGTWELPFYVTSTDHFGAPHSASICLVVDDVGAPASVYYVVSGFVHPVP